MGPRNPYTMRRKKKSASLARLIKTYLGDIADKQMTGFMCAGIVAILLTSFALALGEQKKLEIEIIIFFKSRMGSLQRLLQSIEDAEPVKYSSTPSECMDYHINQDCLGYLYSTRYSVKLSVSPSKEVILVSCISISRVKAGVAFPREWNTFVAFFRQLPENFDPRLPFHTSVNYWDYRTSWKKYLLYYMYHNGLYMIFPNLKDRRSFSQHHAEPGEHFPVKPPAVMLENIFMPPLVKDEKYYPKGFPKLENMEVFNMKLERVPSVAALRQIGTDEFREL
eukprot:jgi/Picre1/33431/NNA_008755.t1